MFPEKIYLFSFGIYPKIFFLQLMWLTSYFLLQIFSKKSEINQFKVTFLAIILLVSGMFFGNRLLYSLTGYLLRNKSFIDSFNENKGMLYGSLILTIILGILLMKLLKLPILKTFDVLIISCNTLSYFFFRLHCLMAGCCYGKPTNGNWGIKLNIFNLNSPYYDTFLHPTQIYHGSVGIILFVIFLIIYKKYKIPGIITYFYLAFYSFTRFIIEGFRADQIRYFIIPNLFCINQLISILFFIPSMYLLIRTFKKAELKNISIE